MVHGILNGIRVLDFTWILAGPYATRILADFGAEVIKIQSKKVIRGPEYNLTGYFNYWNRNKHSITLNMGQPEAREIFSKLVRISDILIENFSPRVIMNWDLDYERLSEINPNLIMISMSGFGQEGPWKDFSAFGSTLQALSGMTYLTSFRKDSPLGIGYSYSDLVSGLYGAFIALASLEYRSQIGKGLYIDLSEYEAICSLMGVALLDVLENKRDILPEGNHSSYIPASPYGCYKCKGEDRWCVIAVFDEKEWKTLCSIMGNPDWTFEDRFSNLSRRKENEEELDRLIEEWTLNYSPEEIVDMLQKAGISSGIVQNAHDIAKDPHLRARDYFVQLEHPILGKTISDTSPIRFRETRRSSLKPAPLLGEDNRYVFMELLGMSASELSSYIERGIIN